MDALTALLEGPQARGAFLLRSVFNPPWGLRIEDEAPVSVVTMVRGGAWILPERGTPTELRPGDIAAIRGPWPYTLADTPATPAQIAVGPDQRCTTAAGEDVTASMALGVRSWGEDLTEDSTVMLSGTYQAPSEVGQRLLASMPEVLVQPAGTKDTALVNLLADEISRDELGQELMLDRLLDLLLVSVVRSWLASGDTGAPGWYRAQNDPVVGRALQLMHEEPAAPWTVASLARRAGVSRAGFARRFNEMLGQPPMKYLAAYRLTLAADLLRESGATVAAVAGRVGYSSAFALSTAFKRVRGITPQEYRAGGYSARPALQEAPSRTVVLTH